MRNFVRNCIILGTCVVIAVLAIIPPDKKLRKGKDLAGGASLVYQVFTKPGDTSGIDKVITVLKDRIDPQGVMEISIAQQGADRIEITMPLPDSDVKRLKDEFDREVEKFASAALTPEQFERIAADTAEKRNAEFTRIAAGETDRIEKLNTAATLFNELKRNREEYTKAQAELNDVQKRIKELRDKGEAPESEILKGLIAAETAARDKLAPIVDALAATEISYEEVRGKGLTGGISAADVRAALLLPKTELKLDGKDGKMHTRPSDRARAIEELRAANPSQSAQLDTVIEKWNAYEKSRRTLDDPSDLKRILRGAGVLNFRITVDPGTYAGEGDARTQLRAGGPRAVKATDARWYKINKIDGWVNSVEDLETLNQVKAAAYFNNRGYVVDEYKGTLYMLCWDVPAQRLTEDNGDWALADARQGQDQLGRAAINFSMDALGAQELGKLTGANTHKRMAVLLDDEVYTAPNLNSRISNSGIIEGNFSQAEIDYIVRVLSAGSLKAKLGEEPISESTLGPELGADNLRSGLKAGILSFIVVAGFMIVYYFGSGLIAIVGLGFNALFLLALMALNHAAFTLPGIAGVILAFGMAVDANVLIYERLREELNHGNDLRTAVRLAYSRAMAPIVDGNITHLITCLVLGFFGTQEIKGFAVTMSIGVLTTLFCQLFITRLVYAILIEKVGIRRMTMLPMAFPAVQRALSPNIDWMRLSRVFNVISAVAVIGSIVLIVSGGSKLLDTEFRGGTKVTVQFKKDESGKQTTMQRPEVEAKIKKIAADHAKDPVLSQLETAEVLAINPAGDGVTASQFSIKSTIEDAAAVLDVVSNVFGDNLSQEKAITFKGSDVDAKNSTAAPVALIFSPKLSEVFERSDISLEEVPDYVGGMAILLEDLGPTPPTLQQLENRVKYMTEQKGFEASAHRTHHVRVLKEIKLDAGSPRVTSAVLLVKDPALNGLTDQDFWSKDLRPQEWKLTLDALSRTSSAAAVQSFSSSVAADFAAKAIVAILLSAVLILIYVGVRFNSVRYSAGALLATLHDCIIATGFIALGEVIYKTAPGFANAVGILPFKIDLNVIAAVLTILGYSLNDKIVVMDRIRENRGKMPYASRRLINDSINQTVSRTIMTGMTTFLASLVLYLFGGEAMRAFAYCFMVGVIVGTYSSIAIAAPFVWSKKGDKSEMDRATPASSQALPA